MICPKCGRRTYKNEAVCPKCGADMTARHSPYIPRVQVKKPNTPPVEEPQYTAPVPQAAYVTENFTPPVPEPVKQPEPAYNPAPEPVYEPVIEQPATPAPKPAAQPSKAKEDLDRTLTFAAIKESSAVETAAVREYNRMKAQLRESKSYDDSSKVMLERLPEGYVYVKMSIDEADRMNKRKNIPKPLLIAVAGAAVIMVFLIFLLISLTGKGSAPLIQGKWQGEIEPLRFGITGIPFTKVDTIWEFEKNGNVTITPQDSLLSSYVLSGSYELSEENGESIAKLDLNFQGESIKVDILYSVNKSDKTLTISNRASPSYKYTFEKLD